MKLFRTLKGYISETAPFKFRLEGERYFKKLLDLEDNEIFELSHAIDQMEWQFKGIQYEVTNGLLGHSTIELEEV